MKIGIVAFDGFTDLDFFLPWDILNRVRLLKLQEHWSVEILGDETSYKSASGLSIQVTRPYRFAEECDAVFFTSGPKTRSLIQDEHFLSQFNFRDSAFIAAVDSGALIVAALGLLNGEEATTYPTAFRELRDLGAIPIEKSFVVSGRVATGARCLEGQALAFWLIKNLAGQEIADRVYDTIKAI